MYSYVFEKLDRRSSIWIDLTRKILKCVGGNDLNGVQTHNFPQPVFNFSQLPMTGEKKDGSKKKNVKFIWKITHKLKNA